MTQTNASKPQPAPEPGSANIIDEVVADFKERAESGRVKYGTYLQAHNGRDALWDAYQEAIDMCMYLRQSITERDDAVKYLEKLREETNNACDAARRVQTFIDGAINWGDLFCFEASLFVDDEGTTGYRVVIQEADPLNRELSEWIQHYLSERGYSNVTVVTEW
jgi:hypothetical protein